MRVCLDHSWREGERAKGEAKLVRFSFANLLSVSRICLKVFIEFWICNKNCINTCNEKTSLCFIIFASLKAAPWLLPDTTEGGGRESWISPGTNIPERCICFLFTALSPPFPHHHRRHPPHLPSWTDRQCSVPQLVLLVRQVGLSPFFFFFANGLICWGMGEGVKGSPNFTGDGFTLLSFISN